MVICKSVTLQLVYKSYPFIAGDQNATSSYLGINLRDCKYLPVPPIEIDTSIEVSRPR